MPYEIHILPASNVNDHEMTENCKCKPEEKTVSKVKVLIHNSSDGNKYCEVAPKDKNWSKQEFITT